MMADLLQGLKLFLLTYGLLALTTFFLGGRWRPDVITLLLIYLWFRFIGLKKFVYFLIVISAIRFGIENATLEWSKLIIVMILMIIFKQLFKRIYVESYFIEALFSGSITFIAANLHLLYLSSYVWAGYWHWPLFFQSIGTALLTSIASFFLFILFDKVLRYSHYPWNLSWGTTRT